VRGKGGHGAMPQASVDPVVAVAPEPDGSLWLLEDAGPGAVVRLAPRPG